MPDPILHARTEKFADEAAGLRDAVAPDAAGTERGMTPKALFKKGDRVEWNSHGSKALGTVEEKITTDKQAAGRKVKASKDEPQYLVRSEKSGGTAVHKPDALRKRS